MTTTTITPTGAVPRTSSTPQTRGTLAGVAYALGCYAAFQACFGYFILFLNNAFVPKGIDAGGGLSTAAAGAINFGLVLLWGVQHSVMARPAFKRIWTRIIPAHTERATYVLASALGLGVLMAGWQPIAGGVWHVDAPAARVAIWAVAACGWGLLLAATFEIDHFALFGVKQPLLALRGKTLPKAELRTKLIYRFVRHPIQTGILVGMWATPDMTASHALFAGLMTAYVMVGLYFEERELVREFGEGYREYRRRVAKLIPFTKVL